MENKDHESWSSAHIYQSQWLQTTISDLDEKLEAMMSMLEGGNSQNQGHMDHKWREELMWMLEEFGQSYRILAITHNQLKSKISAGTYKTYENDTLHSGSLSSSDASKSVCAICNKRSTGNLKDRTQDLKSTLEDSDINFDYTNTNFEVSCIPELECKDTGIEEGMTDHSTNGNDSMKIDDSEMNLEDPSMVEFKCDSKWSAMKFQITNLTKDNLKQLTELARRNDEKRETIRRLQLEVEDLKRENRALLFSSRPSNANLEHHKMRISNSGGSNMGNKLLRSYSP
ncbi:hypothetical protein PIB30_058519 [Stylosanthes scabra]|uniref:NAB domain-containing protein n=1 Tax=Stylosanthes scabra TaxID=79078 RepID=A0ABU6YIU9_9FABA|nr:hypothetical protein [Stylosanthes scabra]